MLTCIYFNIAILYFRFPGKYQSDDSEESDGEGVEIPSTQHDPLMDLDKTCPPPPPKLQHPNLCWLTQGLHPTSWELKRKQSPYQNQMLQKGL